MGGGTHAALIGHSENRDAVVAFSHPFENRGAVFVAVPEIDIEDNQLRCLAFYAASKAAGTFDDRHGAALAERSVESGGEIAELAGTAD